jgi:hypothetical protein
MLNSDGVRFTSDSYRIYISDGESIVSPLVEVNVHTLQRDRPTLSYISAALVHES